MPIYRLSNRITFPDPNHADESGILAVGGDLSPDRLLLAYEDGIFPWYNRGEPIIWWSPNPRMVLYPDELHISGSTKKILKKSTFEITFDRDFVSVITACKEQKRTGQMDTWITDEMLAAYMKLHKLGYAHSVEVWQDKQLVGGVYGVSLGKLFFGESMFSKVSNASKAGFITLVQKLRALNFSLIDCQVYTHHLESLGAREISRQKFLQELKAGLEENSMTGSWEKLVGEHVD